jgi:ribosomal-protein-alanine N-acetyltransferase
VNKYLDRKPAETTDEALNFIRKVNENFKNQTALYWAITQKHNEKLVGTICLFDFSDEHKNCEIGYELLPDFQGQGFMQEALERIIEFVFQSLGLETINAFTHKDNQNSTKLLQKCNFEQTETTDQVNPNLAFFRRGKGGLN